MYQMTASAYLDPTAVSPAPLPYESHGLSLSSHQLSALDMASGMQTIADEGEHHAPYFVEYIDDADGNRLYTHRLDDERVLSADTSLETIDILKDVIVSEAPDDAQHSTKTGPPSGSPAPRPTAPTPGSSAPHHNSPRRCGSATPPRTPRCRTSLNSWRRDTDATSRAVTSRR